MNIRHATVVQRERKNAKLNQEHQASRDYDVQRTGGTPSPKPSSKPKKTWNAAQPSTHKSAH